jgi:HEAT repeat protein
MGNASGQNINDLVKDLTCDDYMKCQKARRALVNVGPKAVPELINALQHDRQWVRWEAAKALSEIGDPSSMDALVNALTDKEFEIRWLAAEGLIRIGPLSFVPVLKALIANPSSSWLQLGAHRIFNDVSQTRARDILQPVIKAVEAEDSIQIPMLAKAALDQMLKLRGSGN